MTLTTARPLVFQYQPKTKLDYAEAYVNLGWHIFPCWWVLDNGSCACGNAECKNIGKHPLANAAPRGCWNATTDVKLIRHWWERWPEANIGLHCFPSGIAALDLDAYKETYEPDAVEQLLSAEDLETVTNLTPSPGQHVLFANGTEYGNHRSLFPPGIDIRIKGAYIMLPPSNHRMGVYQWEADHSPFDITPLPLPVKVKALLDAMAERASTAKAKASERSYTETPELSKIAQALKHIPNWSVSDREGGLEYRDWLAVLMAVHSVDPSENGIALCEAWSPGHEGEVAAKFASFKSGGVTLGTLSHMARKGGWTGSFLEDWEQGFWGEHNDFFDATPSAPAPVAIATLDPGTPIVYPDKPRAHSTWPYSEAGGRLVLNKREKTEGGEDKILEFPIADFTATIAGEILDEHGEKTFSLEGMGLRGGKFTVEIPAKEFGTAGRLQAALESVSAYDGVYPGMGGHLSAAIKKLTIQSKTTLRFDRTGWQGDKFLIPGREPEGVTLNLPAVMPYQAVEITDTDAAVAALDLLIRAMLPMYAPVLLSAVLGPPLMSLAGLDNHRYGTMLKGQTGTYKTGTLMGFMAIWGTGFLNKSSIIAWGVKATGNALMHIATSAHNLPFGIDNYKSNTGDGAKGFTETMHAILEGGEKLRMVTRVNKLRDVRNILSSPICTGEDMPTNDPATTARFLLIPMQKVSGGVPDGIKSKSAKHLSQIGTMWLAWLEDEAGATVAAALEDEFYQAQSRWRNYLLTCNSGMPNVDRVASTLAINEVMFAAATKHPAFGRILEPHLENHLLGLRIIAESMSGATSEGLEAYRFIGAIREMLSTGRAILVRDSNHNDNMVHADRERVIGWSDGKGGAFLHPTTARMMIEKIMGVKLGEMSGEAIGNQFSELGWIGEHDPGRTLKTKRLGPLNAKVLHITAAGLRLPDRDDNPADTGV